MKFLKEVEISDDLINWIEGTFSDVDIKYLNDNKENLISSINYLRSINVNLEIIESIFELDYSILIPGGDALKKAVSKLDEKEFVSKLNDDIDYVDYLHNIY